MPSKLPIKFRPATSEDTGFVFSSWLKSYRNAPQSRLMLNNIYFQNQHDIIEDILKKSVVMIAVNEQDPSQIFGYIVYEKPSMLHYVYVKYTYRKMGIARLLFQHAELLNPIIITHQPRRTPKDIETIYNPKGVI